MNIRRAGLDEKIHMDRYKINREHDIGEAQVAWMEGGGDPKDAYKFAKKFNVKVDEVLEGSKNPNKALVEVHMPKTTEEAGKFTMIDRAADNIDAVSKAITKADGSVDRAKVFASAFNIPFTEGRNISSMMEDAISAKLRAETGAAANAAEVESIKKRFDLSTLDTDAVVKDKLKRLRLFMDETRVIRDPTGKIREVAKGAKELNAKANGPAPKGSVAPFDDAEKERRYQEFKKNHK